MYKINDLYDLTHSQAKDYLSKYEYPWQALKGIKDFIIELGETLGDEYQEVNEHVWIHKDAKVFDSAYIEAPLPHVLLVFADKMQPKLPLLK